MRISLRRSWILAVLATTLMSIYWVLPVGAQDNGFPPWPIIYDGTVELDGEPLKSGMLHAEVGDWVSTEVPVVDGWFACADPCLILGPPTVDYIGTEVTFHLNGIERASILKHPMEFPALTEPDRRTITLTFKSEASSSAWLLVSAGGLAVLLAGAVLTMIYRNKDHA
jgi:hypothetical protein